MLRIQIVVANLLMLLGLSDHVTPRKMTLPEAIDFMQPSIVQISALVEEPPGPLQHPARTNIHPLGSGFLVSVDGYAVTARHVVQAFESLQAEGPKTLMVGLAVPNVEDAELSIRANFSFTRCEVVDEDVRHDLALLKLKANPFTDEKVPLKSPIKAVSYIHRVATLGPPTRPRDGDAIAVSGYPLNQKVLITTSGHLASSWSSNSVPAQVPGAPPGVLVPDIADLYVGDMHVNFGNSGGPVYLVEQGKVIGVCVAYRTAPVTFGDGNQEPARAEDRPLSFNSGLADIVPVRYVIDLLKKNNIK